MARRQAGKENIRSLSKVSNGTSYAITLSKAVIKRFGWKERQKLKLVVHERAKTILIKDWEK